MNLEQLITKLNEEFEIVETDKKMIMSYVPPLQVHTYGFRHPHCKGLEEKIANMLYEKVFEPYKDQGIRLYMKAMPTLTDQGTVMKFVMQLASTDVGIEKALEFMMIHKGFGVCRDFT